MLFNLQPALEGKLVSLRPLQPGDFSALFAVASDPLIWEQHPDNNRHREDVFREYFQGAIASGGAFLVLDRQNGGIIGCTRFANYKPEDSEIEIGWTFLARSHWGGAYNGEMKQLMLRHAFQYVKRVVFMIGQHNLRSQRAVEKIGGVLAGTRLDVQGRESVVYQITAV